jgi:hypothetical protein
MSMALGMPNRTKYDDGGIPVDKSTAPCTSAFLLMYLAYTRLIFIK